MGKTVLMRKSDRFADIFDSSETIAQAQKDGYHICDEAETAARDALVKTETKKQKQADNTGETTSSKSLADLDKKGLLKFAGQRKIIDDTFKPLEKDALIEKIIDAIKSKIVEAGLKTAEEVAELTENDLIALFDTIEK